MRSPLQANALLGAPLALLDPLLWAWALGSAIAAAVRWNALRKAIALSPSAQPQPQPELAPELDPELLPAHAAGIDKQL